MTGVLIKGKFGHRHAQRENATGGRRKGLGRCFCKLREPDGRKPPDTRQWHGQPSEGSSRDPLISDL